MCSKRCWFLVEVWIILFYCLNYCRDVIFIVGSNLFVVVIGMINIGNNLIVWEILVFFSLNC